MLSADDEMPRMSIAIWYINRVVLDSMSAVEYHMIRLIFTDNAQDVIHISCWRYTDDFNGKNSREY